MNPSGGSLENYRLADPEVLAVARQLAPELFAALEIAAGLDAAAYPLTADTEIERALLQVANSAGRYETPGIQISAEDARDRFPNEFLPVTDHLDLLKKVYMAIVRAHETAARERIAQLKRGEYEIRPSHPFDVGDL
ncbi:hypothetical protein ACI8AK_05340 [Geodermatophilus sp. SYSU D00867]